MLPLHSVCDLIEAFSKFQSMDGDIIKSNAKSRQKVPFNRNASLTLARLWTTQSWRDESCVSLGGKEGPTNIHISAKPGIEPGTLWLEAEILPTARSRARWFSKLTVLFLYLLFFMFYFPSTWLSIHALETNSFLPGRLPNSEVWGGNRGIFWSEAQFKKFCKFLSWRKSHKII